MPFPDKLWPRMCEVLGRAEHAEDQRFHTHAALVANAAALVRELDRGAQVRRGREIASTAR